MVVQKRIKRTWSFSSSSLVLPRSASLTLYR
jgi:hypothetical protein